MLNIRTAEEQDAKAIVDLVNKAFLVERHVRTGGDRTSLAGLRQEMQRGVFFVAEIEGRIVGSVFVRITGITGYFGMLAVDPLFQRSGIGWKLREYVEAYCKAQRCKEITLSTGDFRTELLSYYRRAGYKVISYEPSSGGTWDESKPFQIVHMVKSL
jgi:ribosomal protein S18 acetylase RimI-like enzyme